LAYPYVVLSVKSEPLVVAIAVSLFWLSAAGSD